MRKLNAPFATLCFVAALLSCSDDGKGMRGTFLDEETMVLDDDTFRIRFPLDDSTLCISPIRNDDSDWPMIVRKGGDSLYHTLVKSKSIRPIYYTEKFVRLNDTIAYELETGKNYRVKDADYGLKYLGEWNNQPLFCTLTDWRNFRSHNTIIFGDSTEVELQHDVYASSIDDDGIITLNHGALSVNVNPAELHDYQPKKEIPDSNMEAIRDRYEESSICGDPSFRIYIDVPKGNSRMAVTVKKYLFRAICNDIFAQLDYDAKQLYYNSAIARGDIRGALEQVSKLWCREVRKKFSDIDEDEDYVFFSFPIDVTKVAEGDDYATYYYETDAFLGGAHSNPCSYYITYDKQRNVIVDANNTIKEGMMSAFKEKVPSEVNDLYERWSYNGGLGGDYPCDEMGCCFSTKDGDLHFPLPHLAVLPEGVVITFHPYQIGSFADGEFHVLIPKEDVKDCLDHNFWNNDTITKPLSYFVERVGMLN